MGRFSQQFGNYGFDKIPNHVTSSSSLEQTHKTTMLQRLRKKTSLMDETPFK
jgi:hypothetical protein